MKLHRRPPEQIATRPDPRYVFARVAQDNLARLTTAAAELNDAGVLSRGWYRGGIDLQLGDSRQIGWHGSLSSVLVTSPPYGDNTSTVPYGQHAYLPLQWIELSDIDAAADRDCLSSTYEIDRRSLGGRKQVDSADEEKLRDRSPSLDRVIVALAAEKRDRRNRVLAFMRDFDDALGAIARTVEFGGISAWTVGSRRVGGQSIPFGRVLVEMAAVHGFAHVDTLHRDIPLHRKRMAARNSVGTTMHREHVVILRRVGP